MNEYIRNRSTKNSVFSKSFMKNSNYKFQTIQHNPPRPQTSVYSRRNTLRENSEDIRMSTFSKLEQEQQKENQEPIIIPPPSTKPTKSTFYISSTLKKEESQYLKKSRQNSRTECKSPAILKEAPSRTTLFKRQRETKPNSDFSLTLEKRALMGDSLVTSNVAASPRSDKGRILLKETRKVKSKKRLGIRSQKKNRRSNSNFTKFQHFPNLASLILSPQNTNSLIVNNKFKPTKERVKSQESKNPFQNQILHEYFFATGTNIFKKTSPSADSPNHTDPNLDISFTQLKLRPKLQRVTPKISQPQKSEMSEFNKDLQDSEAKPHNISHHSDLMKYQESKDEDFLSEDKVFNASPIEEPSEVYGARQKKQKVKKEVLYIEGVKYQNHSDREATPITPELGGVESTSRMPHGSHEESSDYVLYNKTGRDTKRENNDVKQSPVPRVENSPKLPSPFLEQGITRKEKSFHIQTQNSLGNTAEIHDNLLQKVECIAEQNEAQTPNVPSAISWYQFKIPKVLSGSLRGKIHPPPPTSSIQSSSNPYKAATKQSQPSGYPKLVIHQNMETLHSFMKETNSMRRTAINSPPRHSRIFSGPVKMELQEEKKLKQSKVKSTFLSTAQTPTDSIMAKYAPEMGRHFKEALQKQAKKRKEVSPVKKQLDSFFSMLQRKRILASKVPLLVTGVENQTLDPKLEAYNTILNDQAIKIKDRGIRANRTMSSSSSLFNEDLIDLDMSQNKRIGRAPFKIEVPTVSPILQNIPPSVRSVNRPSNRSLSMNSNLKKQQIVKTGGGGKKVQKPGN